MVIFIKNLIIFLIKLFDHFVIKKYFNTTYDISVDYNKKGRSCRRQKNIFIKNTKVNHNRYFSFINEMKISVELNNWRFSTTFIESSESFDEMEFKYLYCHHLTVDFFIKYKRFIPKKITKSIIYNLQLLIDELNERNIVHRDINPSNIMYDIFNKSIILIDFQWASINGFSIEPINSEQEEELKTVFKKINPNYRNKDLDLNHLNDVFSIKKIINEIND